MDSAAVRTFVPAVIAMNVKATVLIATIASPSSTSDLGTKYRVIAPTSPSPSAASSKARANWRMVSATSTQAV